MFLNHLVDRLASVWRDDDKVWSLTIPQDCQEFTEYYDSVQEKLTQIAVLDELIAGM